MFPLLEQFTVCKVLFAEFLEEKLKPVNMPLDPELTMVELQMSLENKYLSI